jgi:hypothetical protein
LPLHKRLREAGWQWVASESASSGHGILPIKLEKHR